MFSSFVVVQHSIDRRTLSKGNSHISCWRGKSHSLNKNIFSIDSFPKNFFFSSALVFHALILFSSFYSITCHHGSFTLRSSFLNLFLLLNADIFLISGSWFSTWFRLPLSANGNVRLIISAFFLYSSRHGFSIISFYSLLVFLPSLHFFFNFLIARFFVSFSLAMFVSLILSLSRMISGRFLSLSPCPCLMCLFTFVCQFVCFLIFVCLFFIIVSLHTINPPLCPHKNEFKNLK